MKDSNNPAGKDLLRSLFGDDDDDDDDDTTDSEKEELELLPSRGKTGASGEEFRKRKATKSAEAVERKRNHEALLLGDEPTAAANGHHSNGSHGNGNGDREKFLASWHQAIGIVDGFLTPDECDELVAVHSSEPHRGYIDHLEVTRVADLVVGVVGGNPNHNGKPLPCSPLVVPLLRARHKVWEALATQVYPHEALKLVPEYTALVSWHPGARLRRHYDSNRDYLRDRHYSALVYLNDAASDQDGGTEPNSSISSNDNNGSNDSSNNNIGSQANGASKHNSCHPHNYHRRGFSGGDLVFEIPSAPSTTDDDRGASANHPEAPPQIPPRTKRIRPHTGRLVCFPSSRDYVHWVEPVTGGTRYALTLWFTRNEKAAETLGALRRAWWRQAPPLPPQPWETPGQARLLHRRLLERAGLFETPPLWLPTNHHHNHHTEDAGSAAHGSGSVTTTTLTDTELRHLVAHCWWKRGIPLGDLLVGATECCRTHASATPPPAAWRLAGGAEFAQLLGDWREGYLPGRARGLVAAMERWKKDGGWWIAGVTDEEMEG